MGRRLPILLLAIGTMVAGAAGAEAGTGGAVGPDGGGGAGGGSAACSDGGFGKRNLSLGDCGKDVKTLNWILKAEDFGVPLNKDFADPTDHSVRSFERNAGQIVNGIVERDTRKALVAGLPKDRASWYGPGFWGNKTACGQTLKRDTIGVAHRTLPCGTKVVFGHKGKWVRTRVIDRGPFVKRYSRDWDLTRRTARKLDFEGVDSVRAGVIR